MKILRTEITDFGPHEHTVIEWDQIRSPTAICADKGTGKTFLIECTFAALYGSFAWYGDSIYSGLTQGGPGVGTLRVDFEHGGKVYEAKRTARDSGKTRSQRATLKEMLGKNEYKLIAGPLVTDFNQVIERTIGPKDLALSTWFLSQGSANDLCGRPGDSDIISRRREVLCGLIGVGKIDETYKRVSDALKAQGARLKEKQAAAIVSPEDLEDALVKEKGLVNRWSEQSEHSKSQVEMERARLEAAIAENQFADESTARRARLSADLSELNNRRTNLSKNIEDLGSIEEDLKTAEIYSAQLEEAEKEQSDLYRECSTMKSILQHNSMVESLISSKDQISAEEEKLAESLSELQEEHKAAEAETIRIDSENLKLQRKASELDFDLQSKKSMVSEIEELVRQAPVPKFGDNCAGCPAITGDESRVLKLKKLKQEIPEIEERIRHLPPALMSPNTDAIYQKVLKAKDVLRRIVWNSDIDNKITSVRQHIQRLVDNCGANPDATESDLKKLEQREKISRDSAFRCKQARASVDGLKKRIESSRRMGDELEEVQSSIKRIESELSGTEDQSDILKEIESFRAKCKVQTEIHEEDVAKRESYKASVVTLEERLQKAKAQRDEINALSKTVESLKRLKRCFGQRGVKQLLIDEAVAPLENIADDLFFNVTGGKQRFSIVTQRQLANGEMGETLEFNITDEFGTREILRFSGGELKTASTIFRIAIGIWIGQLHDMEPEHLWADETFDGLGEKGTEDLLEIFRLMEDKYNRIVVITHDPDVARKMPGRVFLERGAVGMNITTEGENTNA